MQLRSKLIALAAAMFGVASVFATPITFTQKWAPFPTSGAAGGTPAISSDGTTLYCTSMNGSLYAINTANGTSRWTIDLSTYGGHQHKFGNTEGVFSPTVDPVDGSIYVCAVDQTAQNAKLFALTKDGAFKWTSPFVMNIMGSFNESSLGTPAVGTDGTVYVSADEYEGVLYAVNPGNGSLQWMVSNYLNDHDNAESSPVIGNDCSIYYITEAATGGDSELVSVAKNGAGAKRWVKPLDFNPGLDKLNNRLALGADGTIYVSGLSGYVYAVNPLTAETKWTSFYFSPQLISAPVIGANGMIYVCSQAGTLWGFDVAGNPTKDANGNPAPVFDTRDGAAQGNPLYDCGDVNSSPAIAQDGTIFLTTAGTTGTHLYAINSQRQVSSYDVFANINSAPVIGPDGTIYFGADDGHIYALSGNTSPLANSSWPMFSKNPFHDARNAVSESNCDGGCPTVAISQQPPAVISRYIGEAFELQAVVTGVPEFYQWKKNGVDLVDGGTPQGSSISGAYTATLTISGLASDDSGTYTLEISNPCNTATSTPTTVSVLCQPPQITQPPQSVVGAGLGQTVYFEVQAVGSMLTYQWQKDGVILSDGQTPQGSSIYGSQSAFLQISGVTMADCGTYGVTVLSQCDGDDSDYATATLTTCMQITQQPVAVTGQTTNSATLQVTATGSGLTYQWKKNGVALSDGTLGNGEIISGARTPTLNLNNVPVGDYGSYLVTITSSGCGTVDSASVVVDFSGNGKWVNTSSAVNPRTSPTVTLLNNGKVLITGGANIYSQIYDPATETWSSQTMKQNRSYATATLLQSGKVLVVGGTYSSSALKAAELYDSTTGTWTLTGNLNVARQNHTATLLSNGKVLVTGGWNNINGYLNSSELYDPSNGQWTLLANSMRDSRQDHTATALPSGKVLVTGGYNGTYLSSAEIFDPGTSSWTPARSMNTARRYHTAVLTNGKLFVGGGYNGSYLSSAELYDPATDTWALTRPLITARAYHTATLLQDGQILVAGGMSTSGVKLGRAEIYNPAADNWTAAGTMVTARYFHGATLLQNGKVLAVGGNSGSGGIAQAELYSNLPSDSWSRRNSMSVARMAHTATLLPTGLILVAGGKDAAGNALLSAELYNPSTGTWTPTGSMSRARWIHTATLLANGRVLVAGGYGAGGGVVYDVEVYNPYTGVWTDTGTMNIQRIYHTATLLQDGSVLVAGGLGDSSAEVYNPATERWTVTGSLNALRSAHTATLLSSGKVLVAGGAGTGIGTAEVYDPATGRWTITGGLNKPRRLATATLLPNGQVLLAGGTDNSSVVAIPNTELYDPSTGVWKPAGSLNTSRFQHTATLLNNGKVLVTGGWGTADIKSVEIYNPATWTWTRTADMNDVRNYGTATLLPNGDVFVAGGSCLNSSELNTYWETH